MADAGTESRPGEFSIGTRIIVKDVAGPRLAHKGGIVIGPSVYRDAVRLILDGSKTRITLHKKYLDLETERS